MLRPIVEPFRIQTKDGTICGFYLPSGEVRILAGSFFRNINVNSTRSNIVDLRNKLKNSSYVDGDKLVKDYIFDNPSLAISTMLGRMESGNREFYTMDNIPLGAYLNVDNITGFELKQELYKNRLCLDEDDDEGVVSTLDVYTENVEEEVNTPLPIPERINSAENRYKRNAKFARNVIARSSYHCCINKEHKSFMTKNGHQYMEAHHLIPLSKQNEFNNSLDVEANIVSLCPNCHRMLHYGKDTKELIIILYNQRKDKLEKSGIYISLEELLKIYE